MLGVLVKLVYFSFRKLGVREMEINEDGSFKEFLKLLEIYKKSILGNRFGIEFLFF